MTTILETLRLHQELARAAAEWKRSRVELAHATTSPAYSSEEVSARARDHEAAITSLLVAQDALGDAQLPAITFGNARRIGQLEGEVALQAVSWFRAREGRATTYARGEAAEQSQLLQEKVRAFVDELERLGEPAR